MVLLMILIPAVCADNVTISNSQSIRDYVNECSSNDVITLESGTYKEAGIEISKNLTIQGSGDASSVVLNGEYGDSIVKINSPCTVTFKDLTFTSGFSKGNGGAINAQGGCTLILQNCIFTSNMCGANGGAVSICGDFENASPASLKMYGCKFVSNIAGENGGAVNTYMTNTESFDCEFTKNIAGASGGAIASRDYSKTDLICCDIEDNAADNGGAVFNRLSDVYLVDSEIVNNTAKNRGGAFHSTGILSVVSSKIMDNKAKRAGIVYVSNESDSVVPVTIFRLNEIHANTAKDGTIAYFEKMAPNDSDFNSNYWGDVNPNSTNWNESFVRNDVFENPEIWYPLEVSTIKSFPVTKEYTTYTFSAMFTTNAGKPLKNTKVIFKVNKTEYSARTDSNGFANVSVMLSSGNYTITIINTQTGEELSFDLEVPEPTHSQHTNTTVFMRDGKAVGAFTYSVNTHGVKTTLDTGKGIITKAITFNKGGITISTKTNDTVVKDRITTKQITHFFIILLLLAIVIYGSYRYRKSRK